MYGDFSRFRLHRILKPFFGRITHCVVVGAHDLSEDGPILDRLLAKEGRRTLVEPNPRVFSALRERFSGDPNTRLIHAAVSGSDRPTLRLFVPLRGNTKHAHVDNGIKDAAYRESKDYVWGAVTVPNLSASAVVDPSVDCLVVDTEGYDAEILKALDFSRTRPKVILAEYLSARALADMAGILRVNGYRVFLVEENQRDLVALYHEKTDDLLRPVQSAQSARATFASLGKLFR